MPKTELTVELYNYCLEKGTRESPVLRSLRKASEELENGRMLISPDQGSFIGLLAKILDVKKYLEIGVFTGYSTLWVALNTPEDAKITALDISDQHLELAQKHWKEARVNHKISLMISKAKDSLQRLITNETETYDLALIDANKSEYIDYYEYCLKLIRPGGLIIIDNVLMYGSVLDRSPSKNYIKVLQRLNDLIMSDQRVDICMLPIGDGMTLARKRGN